MYIILSVLQRPYSTFIKLYSLSGFTKESYTRVKEGKQQSKQFITFDLDSNARVNNSTFLDKGKKKLKGAAEAQTSARGSVLLACLTWVLYHYATELRHVIKVKLQNIYLVTMFHQAYCCLYYRNSVFYSRIPTLIFTVTTLLRY